MFSRALVRSGLTSTSKLSATDTCSPCTATAPIASTTSQALSSPLVSTSTTTQRPS